MNEERIRDVLRHAVSRRIQVLFLTVGSLAGAPGVPTSVTELTDPIGVLLVVLAGYRSVASSPTVGIQLSFVLIAFLVYAYVPDIHPERISAMVDDHGVRVMAGALTAYFGFVWSIFGGFIDPAVVLGTPTPDSFLDLARLFLLGLFVGIVHFTVYVQIRWAERLSPPERTLVEAIDRLGALFTRVRGRIRDRPESPSRSLQTATATATAVSRSMNLVGMCVLMGIGLGTLNGFYPVPELLLCGVLMYGAAASHTKRLPDLRGYEVESRLLEDSMRSFQNVKGFVLSLYCVLGVFLSASSFVVGFNYVPAVAESVSLIAGRVDVLGRETTIQIIAHSWIQTSHVVLLTLFGLYGLFYWLRQFRRLPQYVRFWEAVWADPAVDPPPAPVTRPPGLFVPGVLMWGVLVTSSVPLPSEGDPLSWLLYGIFALGWPLLAGPAVWSIRRAYRREPQPLHHEGRDVLVALVSLVLVVTTWLSVTTFADSAIDPLLLGTILLLLLLVTYAPDVMRYAASRDGPTRYLGGLYLLLALTVFLLVLVSVGAAPVWVWTLAALLILIFIYSR